MSPWKRLQLEPSNDVKAIRRAYAQQLKRYHPEEDPEGYQQLRQAYEQIMTEIKTQAVYSPPFSEPQEEEDFQDTNIREDHNYDVNDTDILNTTNNIKEPITPPSRLWLQGDGHEPPESILSGAYDI